MEGLNPDLLLCAANGNPSLPLCALTPIIWNAPESNKFRRALRFISCNPNFLRRGVYTGPRDCAWEIIRLLGKDVNVELVYRWLIRNGLVDALDRYIEEYPDFPWLREICNYIFVFEIYLSKDFVMWFYTKFRNKIGEHAIMRIATDLYQRELYSTLEWLLNEGALKTKGPDILNRLSLYGISTTHNLDKYKWACKLYGKDIITDMDRDKKLNYLRHVAMRGTREMFEYFRKNNLLRDFSGYTQLMESATKKGNLKVILWLEENTRVKCTLPDDLTTFTVDSDIRALRFYRERFGANIRALLLSPCNLLGFFKNPILENIRWIMEEVGITRDEIEVHVGRHKLWEYATLFGNLKYLQWLEGQFRFVRKDEMHIPIERLFRTGRIDMFRWIKKYYKFGPCELYPENPHFIKWVLEEASPEIAKIFVEEIYSPYLQLTCNRKLQLTYEK